MLTEAAVGSGVGAGASEAVEAGEGTGLGSAATGGSGGGGGALGSRVCAPAEESIPSTAVAVSFLGMVLPSIPSTLGHLGHHFHCEFRVRLREVRISFVIPQHDLIADH